MSSTAQLRTASLGRDDVFAVLDAQMIERITDGLSACLPVTDTQLSAGAQASLPTDRLHRQAVR